MDNKRRSKRIEEQSKSPMKEENNTKGKVARQGRSKRIEEQSKSPMNEENNTESKVARQGHSDIATMRETKDLSTKLSLVQRKIRRNQSCCV